MSKKRGELSKKVDIESGGEIFSFPGEWWGQFIYHLMVDRFNNGEEKTPAYEPALVQNFLEVDHV